MLLKRLFRHQHFWNSVTNSIKAQTKFTQLSLLRTWSNSKMNWLMIKILNSLKKNVTPSPTTTTKILLKTFLPLVSRKVGEFEQFSGAEHRLTERPLFIYWTRSSRSHPLSKTGSSLLSLSFFSSVLSKPLGLNPLCPSDSDPPVY